MVSSGFSHTLHNVHWPPVLVVLYVTPMWAVLFVITHPWLKMAVGCGFRVFLIGLKDRGTLFVCCHGQTCKQGQKVQNSTEGLCVWVCSKYLFLCMCMHVYILHVCRHTFVIGFWLRCGSDYNNKPTFSIELYETQHVTLAPLKKSLPQFWKDWPLQILRHRGDL